jgi:RNA polymerase sigma-70 factor (ECF subfamily)
MTSRPPDTPPPAATALESTAVLLDRVRSGDEVARERLMARYLPVLKRWAHGRLPAGARGLVDTDDLVQVTLLRSLSHLGKFEHRREGAFLAYLWRILLNALRDEVRRSVRRGGREALSEELPDPAPTLHEQAIGRDLLDRYETALANLPDEHREAVILRIEFGLTYDEIADAVGSPSANASRMTVARALVRLAERIREGQE